MLVGGRNTGKTTLTQPACHIFKAMPTPQADSFCPLESVRGHELFLWHDVRYAPGHPQKVLQGLRIDEGTMNRWREGLPTLVGVAKSGGGKDFVYTEDAVFIFTGPEQFVAYRAGSADKLETEQLDARIRYIHFPKPLETTNLRSVGKDCPFCWARWILAGELTWRARSGLAPDAYATSVMQDVWAGWNPWRVSTPVATEPKRARIAEPVRLDEIEATEGSDWFGRLDKLMTWRSAGLLSQPQFEAAMVKMGLPHA